MSTRNIVISGVIFLTGIVMSVGLKDWMWFARSGALVTAIELFVAVGRINALMQFERMQESFGRVFPESAGKAVQQQIDKSQVVENWVLMIGTLVWGFGDLLGKLFRL